jgi:MSHA biogenesis protein MshJ
MKDAWNKFAALIDERNARERVLVLATTIVVIATLLDSLLLSPITTQSKRLTQETLNDQAEIVKLAAQLQSAAGNKVSDPDASLKKKLVEYQSRQVEMQRQIDAQSAELVAPEKMAAVLEKILANNPNVQLIEVKTLPRTSVNVSKEPIKPGPTPEAKPATPDEKKPAEIYRHGVQVTMRGTYLNLLGYLKEIESLPTRMFWDQMSLTVGVYPSVTMRFVVYTISLDKVWLTV